MALYAWPGVRLGEHSCNVAGILLGLFGEELGVAARRLDVNASYLLVAAGTAALLHDAGKAAKKFQETVRQGRPSFTCHELVAGKLVYDTISSLLAKLSAEKRELLAVIAGVAALRHHHAMRTLGECVDLAKKRRIPGLARDEILALATELEEPCPEVSPLAFVLRRLARNYAQLDPLESASAIGNTIHNLQRLHGISKELLSLATSALTGLLSLADYLAATTLDKRTNDPKPRGYTKQVLRELQYPAAAQQKANQQITIRLKGIATEGRKILSQMIRETGQASH